MCTAQQRLYIYVHSSNPHQLHWCSVSQFTHININKYIESTVCFQDIDNLSFLIFFTWFSLSPNAYRVFNTLKNSRTHTKLCTNKGKCIRWNQSRMRDWANKWCNAMPDVQTANTGDISYYMLLNFNKNPKRFVFLRSFLHTHALSSNRETDVSDNKNVKIVWMKIRNQEKSPNVYQ